MIPPELNKALDYAQNQGLAVIIGMDSNAHSSSFGNTTNKRGEQLDLFIAHHKLDIENQGLTPTFQARGAETIIDITLTARLSVSVTNWTVSQEYNGLDHNTITFQVEQDKQKIEPTWKWHKADWTGFNLALQYNPLRIPVTVTQRTCEKLLDDLYKELDKAMKTNIPKTKTKSIDKNNPWWNSKLQNERKILCKLHKTSL